MTIKAELEAQILRLYHVEKWRCGTIAKQLRVHRQTVQRVLAYAGLPRHGPPPRPSMIEPYLQFIQQTLETFPTLTASRLYCDGTERGYKGAPAPLPAPDCATPSASGGRGISCVCARCRENRCNVTGRTSATWRSVGQGGH